MIDLAIKHKNKFEEMFINTWLDEKYKWYHSDWIGGMAIEESMGTCHQFVSLNDDGEIIGYIGYYVYRDAYYVHDLNILSYRNDFKSKYIFGKDVIQILKNIFEKYGFNKLCFEVVIGNPIQKNYRKLIKQYGGRIVGIRKEHVMLQDGKLHDMELYEITRNEYFSSNMNKLKNKGDHNDK